MATFVNIQDEARAKPSTSKRVRVRIGEVSLWASVDGTTVTLAHDYPDFLPEPGMTVTGRGVALVVSAVSGRVLTCEGV